MLEIFPLKNGHFQEGRGGGGVKKETTIGHFARRRWERTFPRVNLLPYAPTKRLWYSSSKRESINKRSQRLASVCQKIHCLLIQMTKDTTASIFQGEVWARKMHSFRES